MPAREEHLVPHLLGDCPKGVGRYQYHKLATALALCTNRDRALDIGAHVGLWSMHLTQEFRWVGAFEPVEQHRACFLRNVKGNVELYPCALGKEHKYVEMEPGVASTGDTRIDRKKGGEIEMRRLDDVITEPVDFIKMDCEGFEYFIVQGGKDLIQASKPVMVVEQKRGHGKHYGLKDDQAITLLKEWGAKVQKVIAGDYILTWS